MKKEHLERLKAFTPAERREIKLWFPVWLDHVGGRDIYTAFEAAVRSGTKTKLKF